MLNLALVDALIDALSDESTGIGIAGKKMTVISCHHEAQTCCDAASFFSQYSDV